MKKTLSLLLVVLFTFTLVAPAWAGVREGFSSLILPGTGQVMNGQGSSWKTKAFAIVEVGAITTTALLGGLVGGPVIWAGLGPLIGNHVIAAADASLTPPPQQQPMAQTGFQEVNRFPEPTAYQQQQPVYIPTRPYPESGATRRY